MIPCFSGPSGVGKSQSIHQWVNEMAVKIPGFRMIDLRGATIDASDTRGLPWKDDKTGQTVFLPPDFLPQKGTFGVLFIDEVNRSSTPVMNCFMELFTEGRIGNYELPNDPKNGMWIIVTAINPGDGEAYDVNSMDAALQNRLTIFNVKFDHRSFVSYATKKGWSESVTNYLQTGEWVYKEPGQGDGHYIAPRSWEFMSDAELAGAKDDSELHHEICIALLGKNIGTTYWNYCHKTKPIMYDDFDKDYTKAGRKKDRLETLPSIKEFTKYADTRSIKQYRADLISSTVQSFLTLATKDPTKIDHDILEAVCMVLPADQAAALIQGIAMKSSDPARWIADYKSKYKTLFERLRTSVSKNGVQQGAAQGATSP